MPQFDEQLPPQYGRLDPLYDTVRARAPQIEAARVHRGEYLPVDAEGRTDSGKPPLYMRVTYQANGPRHIVWDDALGEYRWDSGPDAGTPLGRDVDQAADRIAHALSAPITPATAAE